MAAVLGGSLSLKGGPLGRAGLLLGDRGGDFRLREPDHRDPAARREEEHDHDRDARPQEIGGGSSSGHGTSMTQHDDQRSGLQRQEQGQGDGQQPMHDGGLSPAGLVFAAECTLLRKKSQVE